MWDFTADVSQPVLLEFFKALIACCNADGELSEAERDWCLGYCAATGATAETLGELAELERIYADDRALRERRIKAVFPVATPY